MERGNDFSNVNPNNVAVLILVLSVVIGLGIAIVSTAYLGMGSSGVSHSEVFSVSNPGVDQDCTLSTSPDEDSVVVEQFNGFTWSTVSSSYVSVDGDVVTVSSSGLQG